MVDMKGDDTTRVQTSADAVAGEAKQRLSDDAQLAPGYKKLPLTAQDGSTGPIGSVRDSNGHLILPGVTLHDGLPSGSDIQQTSNPSTKNRTDGMNESQPVQDRAQGAEINQASVGGQSGRGDNATAPVQTAATEAGIVVQQTHSQNGAEIIGPMQSGKPDSANRNEIREPASLRGQSSSGDNATAPLTDAIRTPVHSDALPAPAAQAPMTAGGKA